MKDGQLLLFSLASCFPRLQHGPLVLRLILFKMFPTRQTFIQATKDHISNIKLKDYDNDFPAFADVADQRLKHLKMIDETHSLATPHVLAQAVAHPNASFQKHARELHTDMLTKSDGDTKDIDTSQILESLTNCIACVGNSGSFSEDNDLMALKSIALNNNKVLEQLMGLVGNLQKENNALKLQQTNAKRKFNANDRNQDMPAEIKNRTKPDDASKAISFKNKNWCWCDKCNKWVTHKVHDDNFVPNWKKKEDSAQPTQKKQKSDNKVKKQFNSTKALLANSKKQIKQLNWSSALEGKAKSD